MIPFDSFAFALSVCRRVGCALVVGAVVLPAQLNAQTGSANPVRIGVVGPFTGPSADFGVPMLNGIKLAVDEINAVGGYLGRPLELVVKDDTANPDEGRKVSQDLLKE
ncbi:MAG: ABC transporter substrate-binding protein, partial [Burkholderiaceae bacterium]|nr:ABC transporter substrate-binding protein [Burkholderiaceae bacterium]